MRTLLTTGAALVIGAAPFLGLELIFNHGLTGHWLTSPYRAYHDIDSPQLAYGFHADEPERRAASSLPQKQIFHEAFHRPVIRRHRVETLIPVWLHEKFPLIVSTALPAPALLTFLPLSILGLRADARRWSLWGMAPLFVALYVPFAFLLAAYCYVVAPALIFMTLLGLSALGNRPVLVLLVAAIALGALPELDPNVRDNGRDLSAVRIAHTQIPAACRRPRSCSSASGRATTCTTSRSTTSTRHGPMTP
jgi:hypothetical protein